MESLDQLNGYNAEAFEKFLSGQLRLIYEGTSEEKYRACDFRHLSVPRGESHIDALQGLFKKLSGDAREQFRKALERILRHTKPDNFPGEAIADIVTLVGETEAFSVFPAFVPVLGCGPWGEMRPSLFYDALSVLMMFGQTNEAYETTKGLATSTYFLNALVFDAYIVMIRSQPKNWRDDFVLLRERFNKSIQNVKKSDDLRMHGQLQRRQRSLAQSLSEIPLSELGRHVAELKFVPDTSLEAATDHWLINNLFQSSGPLALVSNDDGIFIVDRTNSERRGKVKSTSSFEIAYITFGLINNTETKNFVSSSDKQNYPKASTWSERELGVKNLSDDVNASSKNATT